MSKSKADGRRPASAESAGPAAVESLMNEFDKTGLLGTGAYGTVFRAVHKRMKLTVAMKQIELSPGDPIENIAAEINIIRDLDSPFIVKYLGCFFIKPTLHIVMEFCEAGSLADVMRLRQKTMTEEEIAAVLAGTLGGLKYMHGKLHIHRDIKAGNVLLSADGSVKLADFGVAGQLSETTQKRKTVIGSPFWMAPEVIQEIGHDSQADLWSTGILALEMAQGQPPFATMHPMRALFKISRAPPATFDEPEKWGTEFRALLARCLVKDPKDRATAEQLLAMPFITGSRPAGDVLAECISDSIKIMNVTLANDGTIAPAEDTRHTHVPGGSDGADAAASAAAAQEGEEVEMPDMCFDTMVITNETGETLKPSYMEHFKDELLQGDVATTADAGSGAGSGTATPILLTTEVDLSDLRKRLEALAGSLGKNTRRQKRPSST
jgi:serine/threonine protein kinase